jgi:hypothetical protein
VQINSTSGLSNKHRTAWSCVEDQILENKISGNRILNICTERYGKQFSGIYLPVREHEWLIGSGGTEWHKLFCGKCTLCCA